MNSPLKIYQREKEKAGKPTDQDVLVSYLPLVKHVATRIFQRTPPNIELDDLISYGILGLMDAFKKYDNQKKAEFKTYAEFRIRGAILDELRSKDWVPRSVRDRSKKLEEAMSRLEHELGRSPQEAELAKALGLSIPEYHDFLNDIKSVSFLSLDEIFEGNHESGEHFWEVQVADDSIPTPLAATERQELKSMLVAALGEMNEKERMVITLYYYEELTFKEIGLVLGITESYASQIHTQAMVRLKTKMRKRNAESFLE